MIRVLCATWLSLGMLVCPSIYAQRLMGDTADLFDFVPREKVVFHTDFRNDTPGSFPAKWQSNNMLPHREKIEVRGTENGNVLAITKGEMVSIHPTTNLAKYLADSFTLEYDFSFKSTETTIRSAATFMELRTDTSFIVSFGIRADDKYIYNAWLPDGTRQRHTGNLYGMLHTGDWHHMAISYYRHSVKVYLDQHRLLSIPLHTAAPVSFSVHCWVPVLYQNVRLATGSETTVANTGPRRLSLCNVHFDVDKSDIKQESNICLQHLADFLRENPRVKLEIGGHTDENGGDTHNMELSLSRANAVKQYLLTSGIDAGRLATKGYGRTRPLAPGNTPKNKAQNRRVEFTTF